jgi:hypothetical protein
MIEISTGNTIEVQPLTRKEIRDLKQHGLGSFGFDPPKDHAKAEEAFDAVLDSQFDSGFLDCLPNPDVKALFLAIIAETYSVGVEEKN